MSVDFDFLLETPNILFTIAAVQSLKDPDILRSFKESDRLEVSRILEDPNIEEIKSKVENVQRHAFRSKGRLKDNKMYFIYDMMTNKKYIAQWNNKRWTHLGEIIKIKKDPHDNKIKIIERHMTYIINSTMIYWEIPVKDINDRLNLDKLNFKQGHEASVALHKNKIPPEIGHLIFEYLEGPNTKGPHNVVDDDDEDEQENDEQENTKGGKRKSKRVKRKSKRVKQTKKTRKSKSKNTKNPSPNSCKPINIKY